MLIEITIKNVALIESLRIEFVQGFNVLTGETGSGKSIVVDSLNLVLGSRADKELIRTGADKAKVEALFDISNNQAALTFAEENGIEVEDGLVCVSRELSRNGRNICRLSGSIYPLNVLKEFTNLLIDVHGQHEHQSLLDPNSHIGFLDSFGDEQHHALLEEVSELYDRKAKLATTIRGLLKDASERARLIDMLGFQVNEIDSAKLKADEENKLRRKLETLENAEKVHDAIDLAYTLTYNGDSNRSSAQDLLLQAYNALDSISKYDTQFKNLSETLQSAYYNVRDIGQEIVHLRDRFEDDPVLMQKIQSRLDLIEKLERKYGATIDDVIKFGEDAKKKLEEISGDDDRITELKAEYKRMDADLRAKCGVLSASRKDLALKLEMNILAQLNDLGMSRSRFEVRFAELEKPASHGMEDIEFLLSANPGEPLKPLASVASGGELSRIMLAFKVIAMDHNKIDSMVFDEIDTGVSGRMAQVVGEKMLTIGLKNQVLCVTHLPQIAVLANNQLRVEKHVEGDKTLTTVETLDDDGRVHEIARLVGNAEETESSLAHAKSMLSDAEQKRAEIAAQIRSGKGADH